MLFDDFEAAFLPLLNFDLYGVGLALTGAGVGHCFIVGLIHWATASAILSRAQIGHTARPLADGSALFTVAEADGKGAEELLTRYGADISHPVLEDLRGLLT